MRLLSSFPRYSTGSSQIDALLGGGCGAGRLVVAFGRSGSGKTQLAMQAVLTAAHAGAASLFVDTEGGFRPERLEEIARARRWQAPGLLERVVYLRCSSVAEQSEVVRKMAKRRETAACRLVVIDTITHNFSLDLSGRESMPDRQGALDVHLSEMSRDAFLNARAYLLTNRVTFGPRREEVGIGGRTVTQLVHATLRMEREESRIRVTEEGTGRSCMAKFEESGFGS
jgi:RecA/RadA recombinase